MRSGLGRPNEEEAVGSENSGFEPADIGTRHKVIRVDDLEIDVKSFIVRVDAEPVFLRPREFALLALLASHPGQPRSRHELAEEIWGTAEGHSPQSVNVHVQRLRAALLQSSSHDYIHTVRGVGYCFVPKTCDA